MKSILSILISLNLLMGLAACEKSDTSSTPAAQNSYFTGAYDCQQNSSNRIGARCRDGSLSKSTGSGTCSSHGGVEVWLCK